MTKVSQTKSKTAAALKENVKKLNTGVQTSKNSRSSSSKTSKTSTKKQTQSATTPTKSTSKARTKKPTEIKVQNSRKKELFPHTTFPYFLEDQTEKKKCWFTCYDHARKYIERYNPQYKLYCYTGGGR